MRWVLACLLLAACGDDGGKATDASVVHDTPVDQVVFDAPIDGNPLTPNTLQETGLCSDPGCMTISADALPYAPQYTLWSDGATKKRWIQLPAGTQIGTSDMNYWKFPVGTKIWKEFTRGPTRVETRYMIKLLDDDTLLGSWFFGSYAWNATQDMAVLAPATGVMNANGTQHDIPSKQDCRRCHENNPSRVLGFQAMALDFTAPAGQLDLEHLVTGNKLDHPPSPTNGPYFPFPADATAVDKAAFGYLHANCGGCHNPTSAIYATTHLELRLDITKLTSRAVIPAHATTVNVNGTVSSGGGAELLGPIVKPNDPANSVMIIRMNATTNPPKMPEKGTEVVDPTGQSVLTAWINQPP